MRKYGAAKGGRMRMKMKMKESYLVENTDLFSGWGPSAAPNLEDSGGAMEGSRFARRWAGRSSPAGFSLS